MEQPKVDGPHVTHHQIHKSRTKRLSLTSFSRAKLLSELNQDSIKGLPDSFSRSSSLRAMNLEMIENTLSIYQPAFISVRKLLFNEDSVLGKIEVSHYPFTKHMHIDYMTAAMLMLYVSQVGYLYGRLAAESIFTHPRFKIGVEEFLRMRDNGLVSITRVKNLVFRSKIREGDVFWLAMSQERVFRAGENTFIALNFWELQDRFRGGFNMVFQQEV